jgi:hypothetical protein
MASNGRNVKLEALYLEALTKTTIYSVRIAELLEEI